MNNPNLDIIIDVFKDNLNDLEDSISDSEITINCMNELLKDKDLELKSIAEYKKEIFSCEMKLKRYKRLFEQRNTVYKELCKTGFMKFLSL